MCVRAVLVVGPPQMLPVIRALIMASLRPWLRGRQGRRRPFVAMLAALSTRPDAAKWSWVLTKTVGGRCSSVKTCSLFAPWTAELRRASAKELRCALKRVMEGLAPANASGLEYFLGQCSDIPSGGTSFLLLAAQFSGSGARAAKDTTESVDRIRLSRAPHVPNQYRVGSPGDSSGRPGQIFGRGTHPVAHGKRCGPRRDAVPACARRL